MTRPAKFQHPDMEGAEPPECPVCLQPYDAVSAIPRVLTCGHTTCEACLKQLPNPFPSTIRCTVCTLLVKFPNCPSSLPKNLDLLHFSSVLQHGIPAKDNTVTSPSSPLKNGKNQSVLFPFSPKLWSYEFYRKWKKWILPKDCFLIDKVGLENDVEVVYGKVLKSFESVYVLGCFLREKENVGLVNVGAFVDSEDDSKFFKSSYESRIVTVLNGMAEEERDELRIILNAALRVSYVGKAYGFWYNEDDKCVYMVWEKFASDLIKCVLKKNEDSEERLRNDEMSGLGMLGMEICEILSHLHLQGLVIGSMSVSCFGFDDFGRVYVDLSEVLNTGRRVNKKMQRARKGLEVGLKNNSLDENLAFISPEMFLQLLIKKGFELDGRKSRCEVGCASDVWSLACLLVWLIVGRLFVEEMGSLHFVVNAIKDERGYDFSSLYLSWMEKVAALLDSRLGLECASLREILCRCLECDPGNRPVITELWKCLREFVIKPQFDMVLSLKPEVKTEKSGHFVVIGELCRMVKEMDKELTDVLQGEDENGIANVDLSVDGNIVEGVSRDHVKCIEMKGHLDCITGLAIGGGFLFSSSYDKLVLAWSLQDFTHVHSFKGHEHRVMALVFVDGEQPFCISGDNEGVICIWDASFPSTEVPIKKLYEKKDWRYSGIHAMAVSGTEFLYTGSGDKLVKAWSLQDYTLSCAMSGHKSVVSSLIVCNGVLYSGSWDGTVRLWSLSDHSPLTVLGEDKIGNVSSVLSLSVEHHSLYVGHENGSIKIWRNDILLKSIQAQKGAVFSVSKNGKWLFSGGWDKTVSIQEISENDDGIEVTPVGSIACNSTITALVYWQGKLFVGQADRTIKVHHGE
ncbi:Microtubule binding protein YTM1 (contains WD40 repeats) [Handroanthus impetiginosus]|uniref:Microtubule binding protein YTM1 (Contains WD40 repeats) n=1 Tax=Handroanthus impetiginosus TaxID=429701 RepID=A0A2G9HWX1_9LAMI|nr:Microtubule binding protein YTM1 (contains WD40 repeats) [Handroanthus impetiginosus]